MTRASAKAALSVVFPSHCAGCGEVVDESEFAHLCLDCCRRLQWVDDPRCLTCGFPFHGFTESQDHCMHCEHLRPEFGRNYSVALFRGPVRDLVYALKYEAGFWALPDLGELAERSRGLGEFLSDAVLVPTPLHRRKQRERGYNQSELLAEELAGRGLGKRVEPVLSRVVDTVSQTQFNRKERIRNLKNAFSLQRNRAIDPAQRYIIVDDVFTTGSTVNACAAALKRSGARWIDVLTIGHG